MTKRLVLIVEDDPSVSLSLQRLLSANGFEVYAVESKAAALIQNPPAHLAIVDFNLPDGDGMELIQQLKKRHPLIQTILITGGRSISVSALENFKKDFFHFLPKPFEPSELLSLVRQAFIQRDLLQSNHALKANIQKRFGFNSIIGGSPAILKLTETLAKVAKSSSNLLITGESGVGKELAARSVHCAFHSDRPFVSVNCGAVPKDLLESEFFGHAKGAFTGAVRQREGKFQAAGRGALFLDEIGAMDLSLQVKLLRALQERRFEPVGSNESIELNARIISATNADLEEEVRLGRFRQDLYYRLNIISVVIPPLRERREDIPPLIRRFIKNFNKRRGRNPIQGVSEDALHALCRYSWPGNIRELENLIERLSVLTEEDWIQLSDLPLKYRGGKEEGPWFEAMDIPDQGLDFYSTVGLCESALLRKALEKTGGNQRKAARLLKINRTTLVEKIKKRGISPSSPLSP